VGSIPTLARALIEHCFCITVEQFIKGKILSYQDYSLDGKIKWAKTHLKIAERAMSFWKSKELEYKNMYVDNLDYQHKHIHNIKHFWKNSKSDFLYWQNELNNLLNKQETIKVFG